jgi:hypothetical protein
MAMTLIPSSATIPVQFVLPDEAFERKSVEYRVIAKPVVQGDMAYLSVRASYPDGTHEYCRLELPSMLEIHIIGRYYRT